MDRDMQVHKNLACDCYAALHERNDNNHRHSDVLHCDRTVQMFNRELLHWLHSLMCLTALGIPGPYADQCN